MRTTNRAQRLLKISLIALTFGLVMGIGPLGPTQTAEAAICDSTGSSSILCNEPWLPKQVEEADWQTSWGGSCMGACGLGCFYTCGSGWFCNSHDRAMRKHGFNTWQEQAWRWPAVAQYGACWMGRYVESRWNTIKSRVNNAYKWVDKAISGLWN